MPRATRAQISNWFDAGVAGGFAYLLVKEDDWNNRQFPAYAQDYDQAIVQSHPTMMVTCKEVFNLLADKDYQLNQEHVWALSARDRRTEPKPAEWTKAAQAELKRVYEPRGFVEMRLCDKTADTVAPLTNTISRTEYHRLLIIQRDQQERLHNLERKVRKLGRLRKTRKKLAD